MMIKPSRVILIAVTLLATPAFADEMRVRVFSGSEFALTLEKDESGAPKGLAMDILDRISTDLNIRFEVKFYPWKRALLAAKNGAVDGIIAAYDSPERRQYLDYAEKPFYVDKMVVVAHDEWPGVWNGDWQSLKGQKILQIRGWAYGPEFEAARTTLNVKTVNNLKDAIRMLFQRQADVVVADDTGANVEIERQGYAKIRITGPSFQINKGYFAFSKKVGDTAFQRRFNGAFNRMWQSGEMAKLLAKYWMSNPFDPK